MVDRFEENGYIVNFLKQNCCFIIKNVCKKINLVTFHDTLICIYNYIHKFEEIDKLEK